MNSTVRAGRFTKLKPAHTGIVDQHFSLRNLPPGQPSALLINGQLEAKEASHYILAVGLHGKGALKSNPG
jgi:hypothetical protein